jgi:hypothetical protein
MKLEGSRFFQSHQSLKRFHRSFSRMHMCMHGKGSQTECTVTAIGAVYHLPALFYTHMQHYESLK